jgi:hypothetical protein
VTRELNRICQEATGTLSIIITECGERHWVTQGKPLRQKLLSGRGSIRASPETKCTSLPLYYVQLFLLLMNCLDDKGWHLPSSPELLTSDIHAIICVMRSFEGVMFPWKEVDAAPPARGGKLCLTSWHNDIGHAEVSRCCGEVVYPRLHWVRTRARRNYRVTKPFVT